AGIAACEKVIAIDPKDALAFETLAAFRCLIDPKRAVADLERAVALDRGTASRWARDQGFVAAIPGGGKGCLMIADQLLDAAPRSPVAHVLVSLAARIDQGRLDVSRASARGAVEHTPGLALGWFLLGLHGRDGQMSPEAALADYTRAIQADPAFSRAWQARARLKGRFHDWPGAFADADRALELDARDRSAWELRARYGSENRNLDAMIGEIEALRPRVAEGDATALVASQLLALGPARQAPGGELDWHKITPESPGVMFFARAKNQLEWIRDDGYVTSPASGPTWCTMVGDFYLRLLPGERFYTYVKVDATKRPRALAIFFMAHKGGRYAYWGEGGVPLEDDEREQERIVMGPVPSGDEWQALEVPADALGLGDDSIVTVKVVVVDGRVSVGRMGKR
ncbi:MAG: tetratricopeptide repeat protein, partial [Planctomycetota bacterium]